jgi:hypothetical protein
MGKSNDPRRLSDKRRDARVNISAAFPRERISMR